MLQEAQNDAKECDNLLRQMKDECRSMDPENKKKCMHIVRENESMIAQKKRTLSKFQNKLEKGDLVGAQGGIRDDRTRLQESTEKLQDSSDLLNDTLKIASETEEVGNGIVSDLHGQREVLLRSTANAQKTISYAGTASSILNVYILLYIYVNRECTVEIYKTN